MSKHTGRSTRRYKADKATFREQCRETNAPCWLCGNPINYTLDYPHPESWSLDHEHTVSAHPELAEDPANYRPSHLDCNRQRGTTTPTGLGHPSERW